jgi:hypothetical protein
MRRCRLRPWLLPAVLLAAVPGCAKGPGERLVPVSGMITVKGKPLEAGTVVFHPDAARGNAGTQEPRGTLAEGRYELTTGGRKGAPPGWYKVAVFALKPAGPEGGMRPPQWLANPRYGDAATSGLAVEVVEDPAAGAYDRDLLP